MCKEMEEASATKRLGREKNTAEKQGDREQMIESIDYAYWENV